MKTNLRLAGCWAGLLVGVIGVSAQERDASSNAALSIAGSTAPFIKSAKDMGAADASQMLEVSVWLNLHNRAEFDQLAKDLYDPGSSRYHQWLKPSEFAARYAPTAADVKGVQQFLAAHNLSLGSVGAENMYVRARGTVGDLAKAFQVNIKNYTLNGNTYRANAENPTVTSGVKPLIQSISGLDNVTFKHHLVQRYAPKGKKEDNLSAMTNAATTPDTIFSNVCFGTKPVTESYTSPGFPKATYTGLRYGGPASGQGCGYTPSEIRKAYGLDGLYKKGFDGTGQTIVIIDWCGSPSIRQDANAFSAAYGLPPLTNSNFKIVEYPSRSTCAAADPEINIDVEWAHAIAPGANITLLVPPSAYDADIDAAQLYAEVNRLGNVISGSYGEEEIYVSETELRLQNLICEVGAVLGISANFSSGDAGDFTFGDPQFNPASVSTPAASPFATAIGGVSLALNSNNSIRFETGWGNNLNLLRYAGEVENPSGFFNFGAGGGPSAVFGKPHYQNKLPGNKRLLPDISWLADPYTGAVIVISIPFTYPAQQYQVYGGTSLACPMFSALWAIANQEAGEALGQAAPYVYNMPKHTIRDIVPYSSPYNVTGTYEADPYSQQIFTAADLAQPLEGTDKFLSAIWDYPTLALADTNLLLTFGTDSGLKTGPGWDNVTGVGVPNPECFADYFNPAK